MAQVIINPHEVLEFAVRLKKFAADSAAQASALHAKFHQLGETWRDQEYQKFSPEFHKALNDVRHFAELADEYYTYLRRKSQRAQDYLDQH